MQTTSAAAVTITDYRWELGQHWHLKVWYRNIEAADISCNLLIANIKSVATHKVMWKNMYVMETVDVVDKIAQISWQKNIVFSPHH